MCIFCEKAKGELDGNLTVAQKREIESCVDPCRCSTSFCMFMVGQIEGRFYVQASCPNRDSRLRICDFFAGLRTSLDCYFRPRDSGNIGIVRCGSVAVACIGGEMGKAEDLQERRIRATILTGFLGVYAHHGVKFKGYFSFGFLGF